MALARSDDGESPSHVAAGCADEDYERFVAAARRPEQSPAIDAVLEAWDFAERELAGLEDTPKGRKLLDSMQALIETIGMPEPEGID